MYACSHCGGQLEDYGHPDVHTHWCPHCNLPAILRNGRWIGTRQAMEEDERPGSTRNYADDYCTRLRNRARPGQM